MSQIPVDGTALAQRESNIWGWLDHRKDLGGAFVTATMARMQGMTAQELVRLLAIDLRMQGRHLQAWALNSAPAHEDLSRSGISGGIDASPGDYLTVVDSNVGYNKVDRNLEREVTYGISLAAESPQAELQLTYHNRATAKLDQWINTPQIPDSYEAFTQLCYWNYVRILIPVGSELIEVHGADGPVDETSERGRLGLGTLVVVPTGGTRALTLRYRQPQEAIACDCAVYQYALTIQKQGGTDAVPIALFGDVEPRAPIASGWQSGAVVWPLSTTLQTDRKVTWSFERPVNDGQ